MGLTPLLLDVFQLSFGFGQRSLRPGLRQKGYKRRAKRRRAMSIDWHHLLLCWLPVYMPNQHSIPLALRALIVTPDLSA